jgi:oxygen-dependent protoporphyrinogen oxidase
LGRAAYDSLVGPLLSGIYAGDGDRLSLQSTFPILREMETKHGGLIKGAVALKLKRSAMAKNRANGGKAAKSRSLFETHKHGLSTVVDALVKSLERRGVKLVLNSPVNRIEQTGHGFSIYTEEGSEIHADAIVAATPAYVAAELLSTVSAELADELAAVEYVSTATVSLAYRKKDVPSLKGYGYIIPHNEDSKALACTWTSTKWAGRAPEEYALLRVFVGRIQDAEQLPEEESVLIQMAKDELRQTMGIEIEPEHTWVFRWDAAMPQYNLGHPERLDRIEAILEDFDHLALVGNGYYGIGMPDCINSGIQAAEKILQREKVSARDGN